MRFPIRFDAAYRALSTSLFLPPSASFVDVEGNEVTVRMGWAFRARFPRASVASVLPGETRPLSRGVHGLAGKWLINGSSDGLLVLELKPPQRGRVMGFPVRLRQLIVSVEDPAALTQSLTSAVG